MKILILITAFLITSTLQMYAQAARDTIKISYSFLNNSYNIGTKEFSKSEIADLLEATESTNKIIRTYYQKKTWGWIILGAGVLATGKALHDGLLYNNIQPGTPFNSTSFVLTTALAIGLDFTGILMITGSNKTFNNAIKKYNKEQNTTEIQYKLFFTGTGLYFTMNL